jgi:tol-pal system protein YbgF
MSRSGCLSSSRRSLGGSAALFLVLAVALAPAALAQTGAPTPLRLDGTQSAPTSTASPAAPLGSAAEGRAVAILQNRIIALEEELRRLTGRVEEAEFRERQTRQRLDQLVADLDRRLAVLEQPGGPTTGADAASIATDPGPSSLEAEAAAPAPGSESAAATPSAPASDVQPDSAARDGYVLGTIPRDALLGIPQPSGEGTTATPPAAALQGDAATRFNAAMALLQTGDYAAAQAAFDRWVADFPDAPQTPDAAYWIGEAQLAQGDLPNAAATFARNYRTFGAEAPRASDNLLKLGTALAAMGDTARACQTFDEIQRRYASNGAASLRQALERERSAAGC